MTFFGSSPVANFVQLLLKFLFIILELDTADFLSMKKYKQKRKRLKSRSLPSFFIFIVLIIAILIVGIFIYNRIQMPLAIAPLSLQTIQNVLPKGFIIGKAESNARVLVAITPQIDLREIKIPDTGKWTYSIPSINPGNYHFVVINYSQEGGVSKVSRYPIKIVSSWFYLQNFFAGKALAQEEEQIVEEEPVYVPPEQVGTDIIQNYEEQEMFPIADYPFDTFPSQEDTQFDQSYSSDSKDSGKQGKDFEESKQSIGDQIDGRFPENEPNGNFAPLTGAASVPPCPSEEILRRNRQEGYCQYLDPPIGLFVGNSSNFILEKQAYIALYQDQFVNRPIDYSPSNRRFQRVGTLQEFERRVNYIIAKAQEAGFNPTMFLGYWKSESGFSTEATTRHMGCAGDGDGFEDEVDCSLNINDYRRPETNWVANCARGNSISCSALRYSRNQPETNYDRTHQITYPIPDFDDFAEAYGPYSHVDKSGYHTNCTHTYNTLISVARTIGMCR